MRLSRKMRLNSAISFNRGALSPNLQSASTRIPGCLRLLTLNTLRPTACAQLANTAGEQLSQACQALTSRLHKSPPVGPFGVAVSQSPPSNAPLVNGAGARHD